MPGALACFLFLITVWHFQIEKKGAVALSVGIQGEGACDSTPQSALQDEIQGGQLWQLVTNHLALHHPVEMRTHTFRRQVIAQERIIRSPISKYRDVGHIAFI